MNRTAISSLCVIASWLAPFSRAADPTPRDGVFIRLNDVAQDYSRGRTLELQVGGALFVRTIDEGKERVHYVKLSSEQFKTLLTFIPTSGIYEYRERERTGGPDETRPKITLTLPKQEKLVAQKWVGDRDPHFDKLYERLLQLVDSAVKERPRLLSQQADTIRKASEVVAEEFVGYDFGKHHILNTAAVVNTDLDELADIINGPELGQAPADVEIAGCFVPHHSFLVTDREGKADRILVCLSCRQIAFRQSTFPFTNEALTRLQALFQRLKVPMRPFDEYWKLDLDEQKTK